MHMLHNVNMSLCISNFCIPVLRSETEPLVLQFIYVFHDQDMRYLYCGVDRCYNHFYVLLLLQLLMLHNDWYFVFISYHGQLRLLFVFNICSASFLFFCLFSR